MIFNNILEFLDGNEENVTVKAKSSEVPAPVVAALQHWWWAAADATSANQLSVHPNQAVGHVVGVEQAARPLDSHCRE